MTGEGVGMTGGQRLRIRGGWLGMTAAKEFLGRTGEGAGTAAGVARRFCYICHKSIEYHGVCHIRLVDEEEQAFPRTLAS